MRYSWMLAVLLRQQGKGDEAAAITGEWGALPSDLPASLPTARGHKPAPHSVVDYVELGQFSHTLQTVRCDGAGGREGTGHVRDVSVACVGSSR